MNVQSFVENSQTRNDILDSRAVGKSAVGRLLEVRNLKTPNFSGLVFTVKMKGKKYAHFVRFDGLDLAFTAAQLKSNETDDWVGRDLKFITKKGTNKKGKSATFVNVYNPPRKTKGKK